MKKVLAIALLILSGCAQLEHGQTQPVVSKMNKNIGEYYVTTCSGAVESWGDCYGKALKTCSSGYKVLTTTENAQGGIRTFEFQCKK
jgi:hypothetical protein